MKNLGNFIKNNLAVGFMLFALFLGAGNIIFPPLLGQQAGEHIVPAIIGFLITGVGLPLMGIVAVAKNGGDFQEITGRIHPLFGLIFTSVVYLSIGPLFAIPRTGAVTYEIGIAPYLPESLADSWLPLFICSLVYFGISLYLALNPTKLVDRIGKLLTPALLVVILLLAIKSVITPMGPVQDPQGDYITKAFSKGFVEGYLTMDMLASLVFGIVVVQSLQAKGIVDRAKQVTITIFAGIVAALGLAFVYISLSWIGASSPTVTGYFKEGGSVISAAAKALYGSAGSIILSLIIILACITTCVGLITANAAYFSKLFPKISYKLLVVIFTVFSFVISNFGLAKLIQFTLPVLLFIYPIAIVLMLMIMFDKAWDRAPIVYVLALIPTAFVSLYDGIKGSGFTIGWYENMVSMLPLYEDSLGWLVPAIAGLIIGWIIHIIAKAVKGTSNAAS